jgi:hypothetical protein
MSVTNYLLNPTNRAPGPTVSAQINIQKLTGFEQRFMTVVVSTAERKHGLPKFTIYPD